MKTLTIRVPYVRGRVGFGPAGRQVGLVILRLHEGADVERFEDAASAAEGDLAAALLLERQAERAAAVGRPWIAATKQMRVRAILDADALLYETRVKRQGGKNSSFTRSANRDARLDQVAPLFAAAAKALQVKGRKRQGEREISRLAREQAVRAAGGDPGKLPSGVPNKLSEATIRRAGGKPEAAPPGFEFLTEAYARTYLSRR